MRWFLHGSASYVWFFQLEHVSTGEMAERFKHCNGFRILHSLTCSSNPSSRVTAVLYPCLLTYLGRYLR